MRLDNYKRKYIILALACKDLLHLQKFKLAIKATNPISRHKNNFYIVINSPKLFVDLNRFGISPRKTFTLEWPSLLNRKFYRHFMRGYFDGDGCWTIRKNGQLRFNVIGTEKFIKRFQSELIELANVSKTKMQVRENGISCIDYGGKYTSNIYKLFYSRAKVFMERKRHIAKSALLRIKKNV